MPDILIGNAVIRAAIQTIMRPPAARKIVVVACVGAGAARYILGPARRASRLQIICWDKEGCTSPEEIRTLRERGATVRFAKDLHMKLYWAQGHGAVIGRSGKRGQVRWYWRDSVKTYALIANGFMV